MAPLEDRLPRYGGGGTKCQKGSAPAKRVRGGYFSNERHVGHPSVGCAATAYAAGPLCRCATSPRTAGSYPSRGAFYNRERRCPCPKSFSMWMSTRRFCLGRPSSICGTARTWTCAPSRRWWAATKPSAMASCWPRAAPPRNTASKPAKACLPPAPSTRASRWCRRTSTFTCRRARR